MKERQKIGKEDVGTLEEDTRSTEQPLEGQGETVTAEPIATVTVAVDGEAMALGIAERYEEHLKRIGGK